MEFRPKLAVMPAVFGGFFMVFSSFPAVSGGSMANPSKVIIVHPSKEIRQQSEIRQREKARSAAEKAQAKQAEQDRKAAAKAKQEWDKAYEKRQKDRLKKLK